MKTPSLVVGCGILLSTLFTACQKEIFEPSLVAVRPNDTLSVTPPVIRDTPIVPQRQDTIELKIRTFAIDEENTGTRNVWMEPLSQEASVVPQTEWLDAKTQTNGSHTLNVVPGILPNDAIRTGTTYQNNYRNAYGNSTFQNAVGYANNFIPVPVYLSRKDKKTAAYTVDAATGDTSRFHVVKLMMAENILITSMPRPAPNVNPLGSQQALSTDVNLLHPTRIAQQGKIITLQ